MEKEKSKVKDATFEKSDGYRGREPRRDDDEEEENDEKK